jgi:hypothetical protein
MATLSTTRQPTWNLAETQQRIRHPLQSLKVYIRTYVVLEGLALALLFVALTFWVTFALDFGLFHIPTLLPNVYILGNELAPFDWIKALDQGFPVLAFWMRAFLVAGFLLTLIGVVAYTILRRLFTEFSYRSLALVLERRFPRELGDRLISAVELARPGLAQKYGYSQAMVDHTIRSAAERVQAVPVRKVFNWGRLVGQWALALGASLGVWVGIMLGLGAVSLVQTAVRDLEEPEAAQGNHADWGSYLIGFHQTGAILLKRDLLVLHRVYWPTRAYVEVVRFQDSPQHPGQMFVGRDEQRPDVQARAFRWVKYDASVPDSIRPLRFADLEKGAVDQDLLVIPLSEDWEHWIMDINDLDASVPAYLIPVKWQGKTAREVRKQLADHPDTAKALRQAGAWEAVQDWLNWKTWTLDRIYLQWNNSKVRRPMRDDLAEEPIEKLFSALDEMAASPWTNWDIRKLHIPDEVKVAYRGKQTKRNAAAPHKGENRYVIGLNDLKESVQFWVRGDDFITPGREIVLRPPPTLSRLLITKQEPAYIYYRLQGDEQTQKRLKGMKQRFFEVPAPPPTSESSRIAVPLGTDLELIAHIAQDEKEDRHIKGGVRIMPPDGPALLKGSGVVPVVEVRVADDRQSFLMKLEDVRKAYEFDFRFTDDDNVKGKWRIVIDPEDDRPPEEAVAFELGAYLRKPQLKNLTGSASPSALMDAYLITPRAIIPFKGVMKDEKYGLTKMEWVYEHEVVEFELLSDADLAGKDKKTEDARGHPAASIVVSGFHNIPVTAEQRLIGPLYWALVSDLVGKVTTFKGEVDQGSVAMLEFQRRLAKLKSKEVPVSTLDNKQLVREVQDSTGHRFKLFMGKPPAPFLPTAYSVANEEGFNVEKFLPGLKAKDAQKEAQLHYRLQVWMEATDNNIESGPGITRSKLPITFLVVSEKELLSQILLTEEEQRKTLEKAIAKLRNAKTRLEEQQARLAVAQLPLFLQNVEGYGGTGENVGVLPAVQDGNTAAQEVRDEFRRIVKEMQINQVDPEKIDEIKERIVKVLEEVTQPGSGHFAVTEDAVSLLRDGLKDDATLLDKEKNSPRAQQLVAKNLKAHGEHARLSDERLTKLIERLEVALDAIGGEIKWGNIVASALELERDQRRQFHVLERRYKIAVQELLGGASN